MSFKEISGNQFGKNVFNLIGKDWMLVTAGNSESYNTMTASWGGLGVLWNKNTATIYIRPQRLTYEFIEKNDTFTLSFFSEEYREALKFCGSHSGRDCDKAKGANLTPLAIENTTAFEEASLVLVCKKLYHSEIDPANFHDATINDNYPGKDYHRMYIGEILSILVSE